MTAASPVMCFRKRPVVVSAIRWTGDNEVEVREFAGGLFDTVDPEDRTEDPDITAEVLDKLHSTWVGVKTGQWIVRGVKGELYPLDDEVRLETYDPADGLEGKTPGQAVYEAHQAFMIRRFPGIAAIGWDELSGEAQAEWEGIAQAGVAAFIEANGRDPVDAASVIAEAIVPELAAERERAAGAVAELAALAGSFGTAVRDAAGAERKRIRELADRNGAVCTGEEGTSFYFSALLADKPEEAPDA